MEDLRPVLREKSNLVDDSQAADVLAADDFRDMMKTAISQLEDTNITFDENYRDITELLGLVADNAVATHTERMERITELKEDLKAWAKRTEQARQKSLNVESLLEAQQNVQQMEVERTDLIQEILAGTQKLSRLKGKNEEVKRKMEELQQQIAALKKKKDDEIPTLHYLRKIFRQVSDAKIIKNDSNTLEGFVSKPGPGEVLPFTYDRSESKYDRVNDLWNKIYE